MGCQAMVEVPETKWRVEISLILLREIRVGRFSIPLPLQTNLFVSEFPGRTNLVLEGGD